jgi:hypothetical protein
MGKSLLKSLLGAAMIGVSFLGLPLFLTISAGSSILNIIYPNNVTSLVAGVSFAGVFILLAMIYFGFKFVNENQTPFGNFLIGIAGAVSIIVGILIAVLGAETIALIVVGAGIIVGGFSLVDYGFKTKTVPVVSNVYKKL